MDRHRHRNRYLIIIVLLLVSVSGFSQEKYIKHVRVSDTTTLLIGATNTDGVGRIGFTDGVDSTFIYGRNDSIFMDASVFKGVFSGTFTGSLTGTINATSAIIDDLTSETIQVDTLTVNETAIIEGLDASNTKAIRYNNINVTSSQTVNLSQYHYIRVTTGINDIELTLNPSGVSRAIIEKSDSGTGWVQITNSINGRTTPFYLEKQYDLIEIIYNGTEFRIINIYTE